MISRRAVILLVSLLALALAAPVQAITNGTLDGTAHPNVGALIVNYPPFSHEDIVWCSGTLVAPTLFLTAAHCVADNPPEATIIGVSFDPEPLAHPESVIAIADIQWPEGYPGPASDPLDIAIIELASAVNGVTPAQLPTLHQFDELAQTTGLRGQQFTAVGYGSTGREHEPGSGTPTFASLDSRMFAVSTFRALNRAWLRLSMNPATGDGGTCYGDSGGPNFLGAGADETEIIAAITITGDTPCRATNVVYRLDSLSAQEFLFAHGVVTTDPSPEESALAAKTKADKGKANKGKAKKAGKDRGGKKHRGHRR